jgi:hypothetical protein
MNFCVAAPTQKFIPPISNPRVSTKAAGWKRLYRFHPAAFARARQMLCHDAVAIGIIKQALSLEIKPEMLPLLLKIALVGIYVWGVWKFWTGFHRTQFSQGRIYLALLWPIFLIANKSYRRNFTRALKG